MGYDAAPFGVYALKSSGIKTPKDLEGKKLGAPVFDASFKLFPAFAAKVGIDKSKVTHINLQPPLREPSLKNGSVDFISGHYFSSILDLEKIGGQRLQRSPEGLLQGNAGPVATNHNGTFLYRCRHRHPARPGGRDGDCLALADFRTKTASLCSVMAVTSYRQESSAQNSWMREQASFSASVDVA